MLEIPTISWTDSCSLKHCATFGCIQQPVFCMYGTSFGRVHIFLFNDNCCTPKNGNSTKGVF